MATVLNNKLGSGITGTPLSNVSFSNGVSSIVGEINLPAGTFLIFAAFTLRKNMVDPGTIANVSIENLVSCSLHRTTSENIITDAWDTKSLVASYSGTGGVLRCYTTIYSRNMQTDAVVCLYIRAVQLK